ncbi:Fic family protein [Aneurinibacillus soli]|uniref:Adenosine monophosphate-protein transferase SoFic n=1 Tax=Aneurinibacillus soli TaxID=1500254 RepID=A0A0U5AQD8_9BACL|nr:Fic family protein [Aneurinibacillus soli]PYE58947.1 Fic family protein [Aneurinibacillus soli]BAU26037.1 Adenosine monophosphate-protein transferase SoFic [Aneurinibacillus soli]
MGYELLSKLYYKDTNKYATEYEKRLYSYGTIRLPFQLKPYKNKEEFVSFYVNHPELDILHDQISKQSNRIQSIVNQLPPIAVQQYIRAKLVDELLSTNEIEGVRSTKAEMETVLEIVVRQESSRKHKARHLSLMKSYAALLTETQTTLERIEQIRSIYNHLVQEETEPEDQLDGELFRKQPVDVVTQTNKVVHRGVHPEESIKTHLRNLIHYLNEHPSPMLYKIAISHYLFGYIHPFYDGNGRTSRYISSMYLLHDLDRLTALTLSYSTNKVKQAYYEAFTECGNPHNKGELTFFCETFFHIIDKAQNEVLAELSEKRVRMESLDHMVQQLNITDEISENIFFILGQNYIFGIEGKGMTLKELVAATDKTEYLVRKSLDELDQKGVLVFLKRKPIEVTLCETAGAQLR